MYYASFGLLAITLHFIINIDVLRKPREGDGGPVRDRYRHFLKGVMVYYISDILWGMLYGWRLTPLVYADTVLYFFSMVLSLLLWTRYIVAFLGRETAFSKALIYAGWGIFTFEIVTLVTNFFVPIVFSLDKSGEYLPGRARYVTLTVQVMLFAVIALYTLIIAARLEGKEKLHYRAIGVSGIFMTVFIILQTLDPLLPFYAVGCLLATCVIHTFVVADERADRNMELGSVKQIAYKDPLTNVRNVNAYREDRDMLDRQIRNDERKDFGVIVFDLNDLKKVNDTKGHEAGDRYIKDACRMICDIFKHSPVYRIGGDEFVVLLEGDDFRDRISLLNDFDGQVDKNLKAGNEIVVASGLDTYRSGSDAGYDAVFERADNRMYERKKALKGE